MLNCTKLQIKGSNSWNDIRDLYTFDDNKYAYSEEHDIDWWECLCGKTIKHKYGANIKLDENITLTLDIGCDCAEKLEFINPLQIKELKKRQREKAKEIYIKKNYIKCPGIYTQKDICENLIEKESFIQLCDSCIL